MNIFNIFWCWQSIAVTLLIYAMTEGLRRFVQSLWTGWKKNKLYTEFGLWVAPVGNGAFLASVMTAFPWPAELTAARSARVTYAVVLGLFCSIVYNRIKKYLSNETPNLARPQHEHSSDLSAVAQPGPSSVPLSKDEGISKEPGSGS